ncbi:hypothetical protein SAMN04487998_3295 [Hymenobacter actinosclerus]|uniref:Uncharacterized protein n=1 Tax=Hymenobacter actinosclerus TaxID=82805 RepID=A0A1I0IEE2_9BACT|nr:hypothetical protein SAMN04487998_3295 [Hymenobacter actinosclerus]
MCKSEVIKLDDVLLFGVIKINTNIVNAKKIGELNLLIANVISDKH